MYDYRLNNSRYTISIARKIGSCVFLTPDDITEVKSKMIMTFVASLWATSLGLGFDLILFIFLSYWLVGLFDCLFDLCENRR